jgi:hypothetical protein
MASIQAIPQERANVPFRAGFDVVFELTSARPAG